MPITLVSVFKNVTTAVSNNTHNLWRYLSETPVLRWISSFVFVASTFASIVWFALSWTPTAVVKDTKPMAAIMIDLASMPVAPETPISSVVPGLVQEENPLSEPVSEPDVEPLLELPVVDESDTLFPKELPPKPELEKEPVIEEQVAQQDSAPPTFEAPRDDVAAAPMEGALSLAESEAFTTWQSVLLGQLERHKRYPREARRKKQEAIVYVRITINRDGTLVDYRLTQPSAHKSLNQETLNLIARAQPLPPPPPKIGGDTLEFVVPIEFYLH